MLARRMAFGNIGESCCFCFFKFLFCLLVCGMERCIFCGSTRKTAPNRRFFGIPREPGLKRIQWLYVLGDRDVGPKDRVCAVHFRQGKPSNDPSHEDYVPNLLMNSNNGESSLEFLDSIESANLGLQSKIKLPSILQKRKRKEDDKLPNSLEHPQH
uniref:THAP-type domain-containing protein n=1 Tax=Meloidogyne enterolobii TaxID=390850 RepID=A0A6V7UIK1_MELEN|nr:unnamed protein product [Meloidogyne enterolobii]